LGLPLDRPIVYDGGADEAHQDAHGEQHVSQVLQYGHLGAYLEARIHYVIEEGGGQPNVVPDYASSWYYIRAPRRDQVDPIFERIKKLAEGAALMTETELKGKV
jgi:metal-dependent amidase/aminoacylase/carboxypeptidase family protein